MPTDLLSVTAATRTPDEWASTTLCRAFLDTVRRAGQRTAFHWEAEGEWQQATFAQYRDWVARAVTGLQELGVEEGDRVLVLLKTHKEHHVIDLACLFLRAVPIAVYYTMGEQDLRHVVRHSGSRLAAVEDDAGKQRIEAVSAGLSMDRHYLTLADAAATEHETPLSAVLQSAPADLELLAAKGEPTDLATIVYTSGTTGQPKAVGITHRDGLHAAARFETRAGLAFEGWRAVAYGPMAHSGERSFTHWPQLMYGLELADCPDLSQLVRYRRRVMPHMWFGAPRLWERERALLEASLADDPPRRERFDAARQTRQTILDLTRAGRPVPDDLAAAWVRQEVEVIRPVLAETGLQAVQVVISGSSPMSAELQQWWMSLGLNLADAYGTSETLMISWDHHQVVPGTAGRALPGMQVSLSAVGEILVQGPFEFAGYLGADGSRLAVDADGCYQTGDVGQLDNEGFLRIVDRMNDLLAPTSGHNVSPVGLETGLVDHPFIGVVCVVGTGRPYVGALITLDLEAVGDKYGAASAAAWAADPRVAAEVRAQIDGVNARYPRSEQIGAFVILDDQWSMGSEFVTPTNKLRRKVVRDAYQSVIEQMYLRPDIRLRP